MTAKSSSEMWIRGAHTRSGRAAFVSCPCFLSGMALASPPEQQAISSTHARPNSHEEGGGERGVGDAQLCAAPGRAGSTSLGRADRSFPSNRPFLFHGNLRAEFWRFELRAEGWKFRIPVKV